MALWGEPEWVHM